MWLGPGHVGADPAGTAAALLAAHAAAADPHGDRAWAEGRFVRAEDVAGVSLWRGEWNRAAVYAPGDEVRSGRGLHRARVLNTGVLPPISYNPAYQELGVDWHRRHLDPARKTRDLVRQLQALGHQVALALAARPAPPATTSVPLHGTETPADACPSLTLRAGAACGNERWGWRAVPCSRPAVSVVRSCPCPVAETNHLRLPARRLE